MLHRANATSLVKTNFGRWRPKRVALLTEFNPTCSVG